jgi:exopolysaccharide biosynthesis WecB/TagA/CpsF family protein
MTLNHARIVLGGSPVDLLELSDSLDRIARHLAAQDVPPLAVASINLDHVHHFGVNADWTGTLEADGPVPNAGQGELAWLNLIDGAPLAAQARRVTGHAWPRLAGSDLIGPILALCESRGTRIGFLGGAASTHRLVVSELAARYPGLPVSGLWSPERNELRDPVRSGEIAREIREAGTELLIVGLGKPRQELWIAEHGLATGCRVLLAFGAVVDFLAGRVARAPHWMSANGLEWAWRLALEPSRLFSRYVLQGPRAYLAVRRRTEQAAAVESNRGPVPVIVGPRPPDRATELRFADPDEPADVAVVVVARSAHSLGPLLEALRAECQDLRLRCIVATHGPDRARPELVLQRDLILLTADPERGHAALVNAATVHGGNAGAVLVLDGTSMIERGAVRAMVDRMNRVGAGAVMPRLLTADGAPRRHLLREPSLTRALLGAATESGGAGGTGRFSEVDSDAESYEHARQLRWGSDTALLVRRDIVEAVGDRDERFVDPTEETDYFSRIRQIGAPIWYEPTARIRYEPDALSCPPALAALRAASRIRFTRHSRSLGYALAYEAALAVTAARSITDPAQRRIMRTLLTGAALRSSPSTVARSAAVPAVDTQQCNRFSEPAGSIIIPAHNEDTTIGRTLRLISPLVALNQADVIVVCNGCTDDTAAIARRFRGITVCETDTASKTAALNLGDAAAKVWPRLYLDADVEIEPATIRAIFDAFSREQVLAVRPACVYDTTGASVLVKSYYRARGRIPTNRAAIWGAGAYAVNAAGHERFGSFPPITADDSYVDSLFDSSEKVVVQTSAPVRVFTPRTVTALIAVLARQHRGAMELSSDGSSAAGSVKALLTSVRGPFSATDVFCYAVLSICGRLQARRARSRGQAEWERDMSSRVLPPDLAA